MKQPKAKQTQTTSSQPSTPATTTAAKAEQTPEQQARSKRSEAKALRLAATHLDAKAGKPLTDRAEALEAEADVLAPRKAAAAKAAKEPRPTCSATKADGTPCTAKAMAERDVCVDHRPAVEHLTNEEVKLVDAWRLGSISSIVALIGWGKVRAAIKAGTIS